VVFSSVVFIFVFLPLFLLVYYGASTRLKSYVILAGSYVFYAWWRADFLVLLIIISVVNYFLGSLIYRSQDTRLRKFYLGGGIVLNLGTMFFFKYLNFFVGSVICGFNNCGQIPSFFGSIILPIGLSFFIFHTISYLIDLYRREAPPAERLVDFCAFIALFPHLVAGPVLRYKDLSGQFRSRTHTWEKFNHGALRFFLGLSKKVLIADSVAPIADAMFAIKDPTASESWLGAIAYTVQLYFDFSGYSSMAVGLALMMGFQFIENFRSPYLSRSITEFWQRWHISLSTWLRDYLYISLGGNRLGAVRTYINLLVTMLLGGLWHGANWTFIIWGLMHGLLLATERVCGVNTKVARHWLYWLPTLTFVIVGWVFFRSPSVDAASSFIQGMVGFNGAELRAANAWQIKGFSIALLAVGFFVSLSEPRLVNFFSGGQVSSLVVPRSTNLILGFTASILGLFAIIKLVADSETPFLYFQF
jgi:alginate O-acetyltransferase complex protein AlgI